MNEHIVSIKRAEISDTQPKELYENAKWRIGATLSRSSRSTNTGLTPEEEKKYMPGILGMSESDPAFRNRVKEYFSEMTVDIPPGEEGKQFDLSLDENGDPVNLSDYITYKFVLCDPRVAEDKEASRGMDAMFYIEDKKKVNKTRHAKTQIRKDAWKEFVNLCADDDKFEMAFRILAKGDVNEVGREAAEPLLEDLMMGNPQAFLDTVKDRKLEMKFIISHGIALNILRQEGTAILLHDETLGYTMDEAVLFLENKENSTILATLKARIQQAKHSAESQVRMEKVQKETEKQEGRKPNTDASEKDSEEQEGEEVSLDLDYEDKGA